MKVVIIGGGWAGCAAAIQGIKSGAEVQPYLHHKAKRVCVLETPYLYEVLLNP